LIKNDDGTRYSEPISTIKSEIFVDGKAIPAETLIGSGPPWHFYIKTTEENRKNISFGSFVVSSKEKTDVIETEVFDYQWNKDPVFALLVIALTAQPAPEKVAKALEKVAGFVGQNSHLAFVSDQAFAGNFSVPFADSYCDSEGKKLLAERTWKAFLGSSTQSVRERIFIKHPVFNLSANLISAPGSGLTSEETFWRDFHFSSFKITQTGKDTHLFEEFDGKLQVIDYGWSGVTHVGDKDAEFGDCDNWTSSDPNVFGGLLDVRNEKEKWARYKKTSCDRIARIICISL